MIVAHDSQLVESAWSESPKRKGCGHIYKIQFITCETNQAKMEEKLAKDGLQAQKK